MAGFDNETCFFNNIDPRGVSPVEPQMVLNGQLLIGQTGGNPTVATLTAGTNISIMNGPGSITISASGGGGGGTLTNIGVDAFTAPGTNPVVPDGGDVITITGAQVSAGTVGANVLRTNSLAANTLTLQIQQATTAAVATAASNGVSHFNSADFTLGANAFVSLHASVPQTFTADTGSATPAASNLNVVSVAGDGIATSGAGSTITITSADDLAALEALGSTGYAVRTAANTWALRTFQEGTGIDLTNPAGTAGDTTIAVDITEIPSVATTYQADSGSAVPALGVINLVGGTNGIDTTASGSTVTFNFDVTEQPAIATTYTADTGSATATGNNLNVVTAASDGIATSASGSTLTITSANDLAAVEALTGAGFAVRTGAETWAIRSFVEGTGVTITNPAGTAGDVTISATAAVPTSFNADVGSAIPVANQLNIVGGEGIDTSAAGDTVTISGEDASTTNKGIASFTAADFDTAAGVVSLEDTVVKSVGSSSGTATPVAHSFSIVGSGGITTSATGSTVTVDGSGISGGSGWVHLSTQNASSVSSVDFTSVITSTYDTYAIVYKHVRPENDGSILQVRVSNDNGASFETSNYQSGTWYRDYNATAFPTAFISSSAINLSALNGDATNEIASGICFFTDPENASYFTSFFGYGTSENQFVRQIQNTGQYQVTEVVNAIRFLYSTGDIETGQFSLWGIKDS